MTKFECNSYEYHDCGETPCRVESDECPAKCPVTGRDCNWSKSETSAPGCDETRCRICGNVHYETDIERPAKPELPAWCKVGAWGWYNGKIGKITGINHTSAKIDIGETGHFVPASECRHVTWRPWTVDEIVPLLPLIVRWKSRKDQFTSVICTAYDRGAWVGNACTAISYDDLLRDFARFDGTPCGVAVVGGEDGK